MADIKFAGDPKCLHCALLDAIEEFNDGHDQPLDALDVVEALIQAIVCVRKTAPSPKLLQEMDEFIIEELEQGGMSLMQISGHA